jgi:enoyl-CoA hydratase/carnithine racemase
MSDVLTERDRRVLRMQLKRMAERNAMTSSMYLTLAALFNEAATLEPEHSGSRRRQRRL